MQKKQINALVDIAMLVTLVILTFTSLVLYFYLPSGGGGLGHSGTGVATVRAFLEIQRSVWVDVHDVFGFLFLAFTVAHILLHLPYFKTIKRCLFPGKSDRCENE